MTQVVELVATIGYYSFVSLTLNAFQVPLPPGEPSPFKTAKPARKAGRKTARKAARKSGRKGPKRKIKRR
jgi:hypothetical protein